jgi:hypothetical protein
MELMRGILGVRMVSFEVMRSLEVRSGNIGLVDPFGGVNFAI